MKYVQSRKREDEQRVWIRVRKPARFNDGRTPEYLGSMQVTSRAPDLQRADDWCRDTLGFQR